MRIKLLLGTIIIISVARLVSSCGASIPKNAKAAENFDLNRYLGSWYEIARFDFRFERDINNVMAQ